MLGSPKRSGDALAVCRRAIEHMKSVLAIAERLAPGAIGRLPIVVDLGEVRGFPYYTGLRLAGWLPGVGDAALVGGRYDSLVARFGREREATGFAVDVEHVAAARRPEGPNPQNGLLIESGTGIDAIRSDNLSAALRAAGIRCTRTAPIDGDLAETARERGFSGVLSFCSSSSAGASGTGDPDAAVWVGANGQSFSVDAARISRAIDGNSDAIQALAKGKNK